MQNHGMEPTEETSMSKEIAQAVVAEIERRAATLVDANEPRTSWLSAMTWWDSTR